MDVDVDVDGDLDGDGERWCDGAVRSYNPKRCDVDATAMVPEGDGGHKPGDQETTGGLALRDALGSWITVGLVSLALGEAQGGGD